MLTALQIWQLTRRWLWLLALTTVLFATASYLVSAWLPRVYEGTARLLVTPGQAGSAASSYNDVLTAERLTQTYSEVMKSRPIVEAAARDAGIDLAFGDAVGLLDVKPIRNTQLIQISARARSEEGAARYANSVAAVFIAQTQTSQSARFTTSKDSLGQQVDLLNTQISDRTGRIDGLRAEPPGAQRDADLSRLQGELLQLQQSQQTAIRSYEDVRLSEARSNDLLSVVEPAYPSSTPVQPKILLNVALAAILGLFVGIGVAFLVETFDDRLFSPERLQRFTGLLSLGSVAMLPKDGPRTVDQMRTKAADPVRTNGYAYGTSHVSEAYRLLHANLQFAAVEKPLRTLLVTSSDAGDGKSSIAANLAVVMAQAGQRIVLIDADLRRPTQHAIFDVSNRAGLTSLLVDERLAVEGVLLTTRVEGLKLLPSGPLPPNPSELLASHRMQTRLSELRDVCDVVILDSPPIMAVSDPAVLARQADGTLLVINAQRTRGQRASHAVDTLRHAGAAVVGGVLNRIPRGKGNAYYGYDSYGYESQPAASELQPAASAPSPTAPSPT
jgi:capsular exopolysaccharide synthesis family protein